jgi:aminopeptidase
MSPEDIERNGANSTMIHVDFMIGSSELDIDAELADGSIIPLFRQGDWCN